MHEDIDDWEPDWKSYRRMTDKEKRARRDKYWLFTQYEKKKLTWEQYLNKIDDPYFYDVLDNEEWDHIRKKSQREKEEASTEKIKKAKEYREKRERKKELQRIFALLYFIFIIVIVLWQLFHR